jgi:chromosome segregation ATPase
MSANYKANTIPVNIWKCKAAERAKSPPKTSEATAAAGSDEAMEAAGTEEASQGDASLASIQSQLTEEQDKNKRLSEDNRKLAGENTLLNEKKDKLTSDNKVQTVQITAQAGRISKHDKDMQEMQRNITQLMERLNSQQDNDEQMKSEGKRVESETPDEVHTPEATHNTRHKTQRTLEPLSKPTSLFPSQKSPTSHTLEMILEAGAGIHRCTPHQTQASTSYAKGTPGGSKK